MPTFIARDIKELLGYLTKSKIKNKKIGLIPTMGSLHQGHLALVEKAKKICELSIVTIFINPMQFNNKKDLNSYPSSEKIDIKKLKSKKVDLIFIPSIKEIYPKEFSSYITLGKYDDVLCSKKRKNHFTGVATVIIKLFNLCKPTHAFFGEKDFQQLVIVRKLVVDFNFAIKIIAIQTVRDKNGLALSSRNNLLSVNQYKLAIKVNKIISTELTLKRKTFGNNIKAIRKNLEETGIKKIDYLEVRREKDLALVKSNKDLVNYKCRIFIAFYVGKVRLIDNISLRFNN